MKTRLLLTLFAALWAVSANAQGNLSTFISQLRTPDASTSAQVIVSNDASISPSLRNTPQVDKVDAYHVCIFFDNSQNARTNAMQAKAAFDEKFPSIPATVIYPAPTFKVLAGNCLTKTEATVLRGKVKELFPQSTIVNAKIPISTFAKEQAVQQIESSAENLSTEEGEEAIE